MINCLDLSADFWRNYFGSKNATDALEKTLGQVQAWRVACERTAVLCDGPNLKRCEWFPAYKGNRVGMKPQDAVEALDEVKKQIASWGFVIVECEGYEADDLMATIVKQAWPEDVQLVTRDKDLYQLISETCWLIPWRGVEVHEAECIEKFGVKPKQIRDFLALTGDASDNVPGCPRIGKGIARDLLGRFETIPGIQAASDEELLSVRRMGRTALASFRSWDPSMAVKLISLLDDAPIELEKLWPVAA